MHLLFVTVVSDGTNQRRTLEVIQPSEGFSEREGLQILVDVLSVFCGSWFETPILHTVPD